MSALYQVRFAQAYGQDTYGACNYNDSTSCSSTGSTGAGTGAPTTGTLTNTGLMIALVVTVACFIAFAALMVRFWRRPKKALATEMVLDDEPLPIRDESQSSDRHQL